MSASGYPGPEVDAGPAPRLIRRTGQAALGALVLAIASLWLTAAISGVLAGNPAIVPGLGSSGAYWAGAVGAALAVLALHWIVRWQAVVVDGVAVFVTERSLLGSRTWREPLSNYREIRASHEQQPHRYGVRTWYVVQLWHPEPAKTVELARARDPGLIEARARECARHFGLPLSSRRRDASAGCAPEPRDEMVAAAAPGQLLSAG